jgi:hypothetical protein
MSDLDLGNPYDPDAFERTQPPVLPRRATPVTPVTTPADEISPRQAEVPEEQESTPMPWKAAASSVPRLRQQPVVPEAETEGSFLGFAQDEIPARGAPPASSGPGSDADVGDDPGPSLRPLSVSPPAWEVWLERVRAVPTPIVLGAIAAIVLAVVLPRVFHPGEKGNVSLARIRQNPEAYDGRQVAVRGRAGETFQVGGSYVFNLRQGRDTIVVYSRTRRPALHEEVRATGMLSIGYLDGAPRLALIESPQTP